MFTVICSGEGSRWVCRHQLGVPQFDSDLEIASAPVVWGLSTRGCAIHFTLVNSDLLSFDLCRSTSYKAGFPQPPFGVWFTPSSSSCNSQKRWDCWFVRDMAQDADAEMHRAELQERVQSIDPSWDPFKTLHTPHHPQTLPFGFLGDDFTWVWMLIDWVGNPAGPVCSDPLAIFAHRRAPEPLGRMRVLRPPDR